MPLIWALLCVYFYRWEHKELWAIACLVCSMLSVVNVSVQQVLAELRKKK